MYEFTIFPSFVTNNFIIRLILASILGGIIGLERDLHGRAAGLRTNLLVSLGAAVFTLLSETLAISFLKNTEIINADPTRIAAQIISGIGFLGAGAIIKYGFSVRGLTTAACLWISAAVGMSAGGGLFEIALLSTGIGLFCLIVLNKVEKIYSKDSYRVLEITTSNSADISDLISTIKRKKLRILYLDKERNYQDDKMTLTFTLRLQHKDTVDKLSHAIIEDIEQSKIDIYQLRWFHQ